MNESIGFRIEHFETLAELESANFWFRARNKLILWAIQTYASHITHFFEIGCGTGFVTHAIAKAFPDIKISGSELFQEGLDFAKKRVPEAEFLQLDALNLPYNNEMQCIGIFDVLEHIDQDMQVLQQIHTALIPNGLLFITVPQHQWLWSAMDELACHERRYSSHDLENKLISTGFRILRTTSFVTALLPFMLVSRLLNTHKKPEDIDLKKELQPPRWLNSIFESLMAVDLWLIRRGINLPMGGSRFIVAQKIS